jgi:ADP-dependent NAD(P)H-hydrate dehydratase / NAD(P)H-hydrate epimerase
VLVVGGSPGMAGAPFLAGWGALRAGAGLVRVAVPAPLAPVVARYAPELLTAALPADRAGSLGRASVGAALGHAASADAVVLGPGAGRSAATRRALLELARRLDVPLVVDADALFALAETPLRGHGAALRRRRAPTVLTPHEGEAARLLGTTAPRVRADRADAARRIAERTGALVVLKGPGTLVAEPGVRARPWRCAHGGPVLASGGTGDVLAGIVAALLGAAPDAPGLAARRAVAWHARAGDRLARATGADRGVRAREVADALPATLGAWLREALHEVRRDVRRAR